MTLHPIWAIATAVVVIALVGGTVHSCADSRKSFYEAQAQCTKDGGSWIPTGSNEAGSTRALCIKLAR